MEGPKVLFRFTIALLGLYEEDILAHSDTISVIKVLKAGVRLALDVDGLVSQNQNKGIYSKEGENIKKKNSIPLIMGN
jgi:hypothetical protein